MNHHTWLSFTSMKAAEKKGIPKVSHAKGIRFYDESGKGYIDAVSSWWCMNLGHSHPKLLLALEAQMKKTQHVMLAGLSHEPIEKLSQSLCQKTGHERVFYASDGASAVECSLRMILEYHALSGAPKRTKMVSLSGAYHGDTMGAVSLGFVDTFHKSLEGVIVKSLQAKAPNCIDCPFGQKKETCHAPCFEAMETLLQKHEKEVAAVFVEPLIQGASGVLIYPEIYLQKLDTLCKKLGILWVADEIAVGYGRTGSFFAVEKAGVMPDLLILGKGMSGGYLPISAVLVSKKIYEAFEETTFFYGHTYSGNPLAAAVSNAVLSVYETQDLLLHVTTLAPKQHALFERAMDKLRLALKTPIKSAHLGLVSAAYFPKKLHPFLSLFQENAQKLGLWIRPLSGTLYLWPPLNIKEEELEELFFLLEKALKDSWETFKIS